MKKVLVIVAILLLSGCAAMRESGWWEHKTQWASCEHAKFSLVGYKNPTFEDLKVTEEKGWWGKEIPVVYTYDHLLMK